MPTWSQYTMNMRIKWWRLSSVLMTPRRTLPGLASPTVRRYMKQAVVMSRLPLYIYSSQCLCNLPPLCFKTNSWFWSDGTKFEYSKWNPNEPNHTGGECCGHINWKSPTTRKYLPFLILRFPVYIMKAYIYGTLQNSGATSYYNYSVWKTLNTMEVWKDA